MCIRDRAAADKQAEVDGLAFLESAFVGTPGDPNNAPEISASVSPPLVDEGEKPESGAPGDPQNKPKGKSS